MRNRVSEGVSVVLPVYFSRLSIEAVRLLRRSLESVLDQAGAAPFEILLVDDGSPVPVASVAVELGAAASRVRWLRLARNGGIVGALNTGIAAARHPLVARLDADDRWLAGKLDAQLALFRDDPDLSITATGMVRVTTEGDVIDTHVRPGGWAGVLRFFVEGGCPFPHGSVIARREVYQLLSGYAYGADVRHCEDYALWGKWLRFFKPAMIEAPLYEYRVSGGSVSSRHAAQQHQASQAVRERFAALELTEVLPRALPELAKALNSSTLAAGRLAYTLWEFGGALAVPEAALTPLSAILPDRVLEPAGQAAAWWSAIGLPEGPEDRLLPVSAKPFI
jgi:glycosyltransferase involved in cell wall biosynthesis